MLTLPFASSERRTAQHHVPFALVFVLTLATSPAFADTESLSTEVTVTATRSGTAGNPLVLNFAGGALVNGMAWNGTLVGDYVTLLGSANGDIVVKVGDFRPFNVGGVSTATSGECDFKLVGPVDPGSVENNVLAQFTTPGFWGHSGDIVIENAQLRLTGTKEAMIDSLPYGPGHGGVKVSTSPYAFGKYGAVGKLNLYQRSQSINWLDASANGMVTNSLSGDSRSATLTFGRGDVVGYAKGPIGGNIHVVKTGSGAFTLHDTSMPDLTINEGSVSVVGTAAVGPLTARPGVSVAVADGGTLKTDSIVSSLTPVTDESAYFFGKVGDLVHDGSIAKVMELAGKDGSIAVSIAAGGLLEFGDASDKMLERIVLTSSGTLRKVGAGACTVSCDAPQTLGGTIHVANGSLAFAGTGNTNEWWKFVVTKVQNNAGKLRFGQFGLFDKDGNKLWTSMRVTEGTAVTALAAGNATYTTPSGWSFEGDTTPARIFTGNWYDYLQVSGMPAQQDQSARPFEVALRLPAGANPVAYFAFSAMDAYGPAAFHVECSPTGEEGTWSTVGSGTWTPDGNHYYYWIGDGTWGGICGMPWRIDSNVPPNANVSGATLRVDSGAALDLAGATGDIAGIEIDWIGGGGTISGLAAPRGGTLALVNVPDGANVLDTSLATLSGCGDKANFHSWNVTVNGTTKKCRVFVDADDTLRLGGNATVLIVR